MVLGYFITGAASPFTLVAPYTEIKQSLEIYKDKNFDPHDVSDIVSGIYNAFYAIGGIIGPVFG